jgi:hypothetical protein
MTKNPPPKKIPAGGPINPPITFATPTNGATRIQYTRYVDIIPAFVGEYIKSSTPDAAGVTVWNWSSLK